jgi:hypothetical protein
MFNAFLFDLLARCYCRKSGHLLRVTSRRLLTVAEFPRVTDPPGGVKLVPEILAISLLACCIHRKLTFEEVFSRALEIAFRATALEGFLL